MSIIEAGWLTALALVPLFFNVYGSRIYESDKIALFRSIVLVMAAAWLWRAAARKRCPEDASASAASRVSISPRPRGAIRLVSLSMLVTALWVAVSSLLSVDPRISWLGSFEWFAGAWTELAYVAFFALVAATLRSLAQVRRVVFVVAVTSSAAAAYALLQIAGLDPRFVPVWETRPYSTLGNPIFLSAYLTMSVFVTALGFHFLKGERTDSFRSHMARLALTAAITLQIAAIVLSQSRGPFLGLGVSLCVGALLGVARLRRAGTRTILVTRTRIAVLVVTVVGSALLTLVALPDSPLSPVRDVPVVGRLTTAFDAKSASFKVRTGIWEGVAARLASDRPVQAPAAPADELDGLRAIIGYGPETFRFALDRHIDPYLAGRRFALDRAHNEPFELLITQGAVGLAMRLALYGGILALGFHLTGLVDSRRRQIRFWIALAIGLLLGAVIPYFATGTWAYSGVGLSSGLVGSVVVLVVWFTSPGRKRPEPTSGRSTYWIAAAAMAALIGHLAELAVGISVVSTRITFLFLAALLTALAVHGELPDRGIPVDAGTSDGPNAGRHSPVGGVSTRSFLLGMLIAVMLIPIGYALTLNTLGADTSAAVLGDALAGEGGRGGPGAFLWLPLWTIAAGAALLPLVAGGSRGSSALLGRTVGWAVVLGGGYTVYQASRVARVAEIQRGDVGEAVHYAVGHISVVFALAALAVLVGGIALAGGPRALAGLRHHPLWTIAGLLLLTGAVLVSWWGNLRPVQADMLSKQGVSFSEARLHTYALDATADAVETYAPEPRYRSLDGQIAAAAASGANDEPSREELLERAEHGFTEAVDLAPLEPDHRANLARFFLFERGFVESAEVRDLLERAAGAFDAALDLRPSSIDLLAEAASVQLELGNEREAVRLLGVAEQLRRESRAERD